MKFWIIVLGLFWAPILMASTFVNRDSLISSDSNWHIGLTLGFDFAQLLHINPQQGAGQNKLSLNTAINLVTSYNNGHLNWENDIIWQFGAQRLGSGLIGPGLNIPVPFQKSIDDFRMNSKLSFRLNRCPYWFSSLNFGMRTLITPTFNGDNRLPGNFFKDIFTEGNFPSSKFLSPAIFTISIGSEYKRKEGFAVFYSPISIKYILVENDFIASTGVHGNKIEGLPDSNGIYESFENTNLQFGSFIRMSIQKDIIKSHLNYQGSLILFSNYLNNPQNIDLDIVNTFNWKLYKNFNFSLMVNLFYDHDVLVQITDRYAFGGISGLGKRLSITQQFLVTYQVKF